MRLLPPLRALPLLLVPALPALAQAGALDEAARRLAERLAASGAAAAVDDAAGAIDFGDDSGDYAGNGECDDRRFTGPGMAADLTWESVGRDATDCRRLMEQGRVRPWSLEAARAATDCAAIDFGSDSADYANDGECDDPRMEGLGMASVLLGRDAGRDASDCSRLCRFGLIFLRDH